jgi:uracil-DNA glycosylase
MELQSETFQNPAGALLWQLESGVDMPLSDVLIKVTVNPVQMPVFDNTPRHPSAPHSHTPHPLPPIIATPEAKSEAIRLATAAQTLDELRAAIQNFDGIQIKRHASNIVFSDGTPSARVMVVGDAPGTDDDQQGRPFCGEDGALLDKMFASIGLSRYAIVAPLYITTILNWRPPGNRTPTPAEFDISLPFIERHIALVRPDILVCVGGEAAKLLFGTTDGITKIHGVWRDYQSLSLPIEAGFKTRAMAIYHPSFLVRTPTKKREAWADLQKIQSAVADLPAVG